jgi:alpha-aminoadipic semialdehyde synthase
MERFVRHQRHIKNRLYRIVLHREEKFRSKDGSGFYFEDYLKQPDRFESNLDKYLPHLNMLIHTSYWDRNYPRLLTKRMIHRLYRKKGFRLEFIGDLSCDVNGSIEITSRTTTVDEPVYTYDPAGRRYRDGYESPGITILARDNLPSELSKDSSNDFSSLVREYVYQIAAHGAKNIADHIAIPREVREAVIVQKKRLTEPYRYLKRYIR